HPTAAAARTPAELTWRLPSVTVRSPRSQVPGRRQSRCPRPEGRLRSPLPPGGRRVSHWVAEELRHTWHGLAGLMVITGPGEPRAGGRRGEAGCGGRDEVGRGPWPGAVAPRQADGGARGAGPRGRRGGAGLVRRGLHRRAPGGVLDHGRARGPRRGAPVHARCPAPV